MLTMLLSPIDAAVIAASIGDRLGDWRFNGAMALPLRLTVAQLRLVSEPVSWRVD
jgi:hypothetical protein